MCLYYYCFNQCFHFCYPLCCCNSANFPIVGLIKAYFIRSYQIQSVSRIIWFVNFWNTTKTHYQKVFKKFKCNVTLHLELLGFFFYLFFLHYYVFNILVEISLSSWRMSVRQRKCSLAFIPFSLNSYLLGVPRHLQSISLRTGQNLLLCLGSVVCFVRIQHFNKG